MKHISKLFFICLFLISLATANVDASWFGDGWFGWSGGGDDWAPLQSAMQWQGYTPTPGSYAFGNRTTTTNTDSVFTLRNPGNDLLEAATLTVAGTGYSLLSTTCGTNPFDLALLTTCTATVRFTPGSAGTLTGTLTAAAPNLTDQVVNLSGVGVAPAAPVLAWSGGTGTFGNVTQNTTSTHQTFTLTNSGGASATSLTLSTGNAVFRNFSTTCGGSLAASGTCTTTVAFTPTAAQAYSSYLRVASAELGNTDQTLTGTGVSSEGSAPANSTVWWSASSSTLNTFNATDGSTVTLVNSPSFVAGYTGNGLHATGTGAAHFVATSGNSISASSGRAEFDFKSDSGFPGNPSAWFFVHDYNSSDGRLALYYTSATAANFQYAGTVYGLTTADIFDNSWHHIKVAWVASSTVEITVDANAPVSVAIGAAPSMPTGNLWWGNRASDTARPVNGILDNITLGP